jgi:hypothetical protein
MAQTGAPDGADLSTPDRADMHSVHAKYIKKTKPQ